jgi:hypothetical protein
MAQWPNHLFSGEQFLKGQMATMAKRNPQEAILLHALTMLFSTLQWD